MNQRWNRLAALLAAFSAAGALPAATIIPPRNLADMARAADAVVLAVAQGSESSKTGILSSTRARFVVSRGVAGSLGPGDAFTTAVPGGEVDGVEWLVPGSPRFEPGASYLLCLQRRADGLYQPCLLAYGVLVEMVGKGGAPLLVPIDEGAETAPVARPDGEEAEPMVACERDALIGHLEAVLAGGEAWDLAVARGSAEALLPDGSGAAPPAGCLYFNENGVNFRRQSFDSGGTESLHVDSRGDPSLPGGGFREVQSAMDVWMAIPRTSFNILDEGPVALAFDCAGGAAQDGVIVFGDPCSELENNGILAVGGPLATGSHTFAGAQWRTIVGSILLVNDGSGGIGSANYVLMLAHEMGHGLGYNHTNDGNSIMFATCCHTVNALDTRCAQYTYPAKDATNARPTVDGGGSRTMVLAGNTGRLRGTATDDGKPAGRKLSFAWRQIAGAGRLTFGSPATEDTTVTFSQPGQYLVSFTAHDGELLRTSVAQLDARLFVGSVAEATFQNGVRGYKGAVDTGILQSVPTAQNGSAVELRVDGDEPGGSGQDAEVLLRFDDIFGAADGQVAPGANITGAWLDVATTNTGTGASFHRMKQDWEPTATWNTFGGNGIQDGTEAETVEDARTAGADGTVRVDVTKSLAAWSEDPCSNEGWALLPIGDDGWVFSSSEGATHPKLTVDYSIVERRKLIGTGDRWWYWKGTRQPPAGWAQIDFTPGAGWFSGATGIGYGDGDDATVLSDMQGSYVSIFCRRELDLQDASSIGRLLLSMDYDDGFIAYLNGVEVARSAGFGTRGTPVSLSAVAPGHDAGSAEVFSLDPGALVQGKNVLAVEVHNSSLDSSDLSFIPELLGDVLLIGDGVEWRYLKGSSAPSADWARAEFDDSSWEEGPTGIGFGDGDDLTELTDMQGVYLTVFARRSFDLPDAGATASPILTVIYDDGVVIYLNGEEVARENMPAGAATWNTRAASSIEPRPATIPLPVSLLRLGRNQLAVSIHNATIDNSDLSFNAVLVPAHAKGGGVICGGGFRRGDVSGDGSMDISDAIKLLQYLFLGAGALPCEDAADVNDDGVVQLTDAVTLLDYLFRGAAAPPAPGTSCGVDPTQDELPACSACEE